MDYQEKNLMKDDILTGLSRWCCDIFENRIVKIILFVIFVIHSSLALIQIYFIIYVFNSKEFASYGPFFFGIFLSLGSMRLILFKSHIYNQIGADFDLWEIDEENADSVIKETKLITVIVQAALVLTIVVGFAFVLPTSSDYDRFFAVRLICDYCPNYSQILYYLYKLTIPVVGYAMAVPPVMFTYYAQHICYQLMMLSKHIRFSSDPVQRREDDLEKLIYDENYQKEFHRRIVFCIRREIVFTEMIVKKNDELSYLIGFFFITSCALGISIILFVMMFSDMIFKEKLMLVRITCLSVLACFFFSIGILSGQAAEDETNQIVENVCAIEWYFLNRSNARTYMIFLSYNMKMRRFEFLNTSVNLQLGVAIGRQIYGIGSVLLNLKSRFVTVVKT
ncbi:hypothetical protein Zmor_006411 [Zophobas morio]|uniref:Odorant receptor n=1 Tax=Zophobas morio TaxID=2755281 RepID=A0AA38IW02_9CUCU|nr:hypothetical protein Zmor_006411 [Zophobas morio]